MYTALNAEQGLSILQAIQVEVVIVDQNMPFMSGLEFLSLSREISPETIRIMITGEADLSLALRAINEGEIYRFFTKPYNEIELGIALREALKHKRIFGQNRKALEVLKMQAAYIDHLEREHPGITHIERDETGCVLISGGLADYDGLIEELEDEIEALEKTH